MAIAVDASTPVRWSTTINRNGTVDSASFTAPANALLVCTLQFDSGSSTIANCTVTVSDSGGLIWTKQVERQIMEGTTGALSAVWTARTTSAVSRTLTLTRGNDGDSALRRISALVYVLTGVDVDGTPVDTVGANNEGTSATNNLTTTSITPGANGLLICSDCEWNNLGVMTSTDLTIDTVSYAGSITVCSGYKACTSGVGVTGNLDAGGTGTPQHKWCQITVREVAGAAGDILPQMLQHAG